MADYRNLTVWKKGIDLVVVLYAYTADFPREEIYGLTSQMRRAAVSVPSNIAEGSRRRGRDMRNFLTIAYGSVAELETQLLICGRLGFGNEEKRREVALLLDEVLKMLNRMVSTHYALPTTHQNL